MTNKDETYLEAKKNVLALFEIYEQRGFVESDDIVKSWLIGAIDLILDDLGFQEVKMNG
jgi:hypothetical protein